MASAAVAAGFDRQKQGVLVAIGPDFRDFLNLARRVALAPERLARARPIMRHAGLKGEAQGFRVHIREHEDLPVARVLRHAGDQPIGIEARRERDSFF